VGYSVRAMRRIVARVRPRGFTGVWRSIVFDALAFGRR